MFQMYYRGGIPVESPPKHCRTLCKQTFFLATDSLNAYCNIDFNVFLSFSRFINNFLKNAKEDYILRRLCPQLSDFDWLTCLSS